MLDLLLVVRLELLEHFIEALPLLVVATALEEVTAKVVDVDVHVIKQGERRCGCIAEVHLAFIDVREDHLLVEVVDAAWVVADV